MKRHNQEIKVAFFDLNRTLHSDQTQSILGHAIKTLGVVPDKNIGNVVKLLLPGFERGETSEEKFWSKFMEMTHASNALPKGRSLFEEGYRMGLTKFEGTFGVVEDLKKSGVRVAILTNIVEPMAKVAEEMGFFQPFEMIIRSDQIKSDKSQELTYWVALNAMQINSQSAVLVDDSPENVLVARRTKMKGLVYESATQTRSALREIGIQI